MARTVNSPILQREVEGLDKPPCPGTLGWRIYEQISKEGWRQWLERLTMILNENGLSTADPDAI